MCWYERGREVRAVMHGSAVITAASACVLRFGSLQISRGPEGRHEHRNSQDLLPHEISDTRRTISRNLAHVA